MTRKFSNTDRIDHYPHQTTHLIQALNFVLEKSEFSALASGEDQIEHKKFLTTVETLREDLEEVQARRKVIQEYGHMTDEWIAAELHTTADNAFKGIMQIIQEEELHD